ncbi:MAG: ABC transporter substrate-binding protein [Chitinophagales bacterium]|nr:ABC transporter substrate-binding protein [Chitinophagaceae bacterium]MCB9065991.1 ABC transporter substrate-binding protein [Chitinophagales bacterium]
MRPRKTFNDMLGREVTINYPAKRIISLVPSQTELLADLGLNDEVVGITKFCVHPEAWFRSKERVGGTKTLNIDKIRELKPDLIIANKEENEKEQIEELANEFPVWISDVDTLPHALLMMQVVGQMTGTDGDAVNLVDEIVHAFTGLNHAAEPKKVAYLMWRDPWMTVGGDTFIGHMIHVLGWKNAYEKQTRYPEVTAEDLKAINPDMVLLSSEPFPFKEKHIAEVKTVLPNAQVKLVDGEMFSWYGSRLLKATDYFRELLSE